MVGIAVPVVVLLASLNACSPQRSILQQVLHDGKLQVLTRTASTTYYEGPHGPSGLEYELARRFADYLGVELVIKTRDNLDDLLKDIQRGKAHLAAAGLTVTEQRQQRVLFTTPYQQIKQQVVYHHNNRRPRSLEDLIDGHLEVVANSSHVERLKALVPQVAGLRWTENKRVGSTELLNLVAEQVVDYTIADSNEISINRLYHPTLRVAFDLSDDQDLAWAMPIKDDLSLYTVANNFISEIEASGELNQIIRRHYSHLRNYDYAGTTRFISQIRERLPRYHGLFLQAAERYELDWRLLAATAYQESHWNPRAVSPTGVRGIMMLTQNTAEYLGVLKRTDAEQSIDGGSRYLRKLIDKLPGHIKEPDRTWLALASYNVGYGHVQDARMLTAMRGGNPDKWVDVKDHLPLLRQRHWYKQTRYGYARGMEPVRYVENIRSYYTILNWQLNNDLPYKPRRLIALNSAAL
ncbi:MAG: membrane-bound lytic murein transglycosylase MltF [Gammaproteobacteria bacterium]